MIDGVNLKKVEKRLGAMKKKAPVVISRSLNRAISSLNTNLSKETRKKYHLKAKKIKSTLTTTKASRARLGAATMSRGSRLSLIHYKVNKGRPNHKNPEKSKPVKVAVRKDGGLKELLHAFISEELNGHIFERSSKKRLPIEKKTSLAVPQTFGDKMTRRKIRKEAWKTYRKRLDHEIGRVMEMKR